MLYKNGAFAFFSFCLFYTDSLCLKIIGPFSSDASHFSDISFLALSLSVSDVSYVAYS